MNYYIQTTKNDLALYCENFLTKNGYKSGFKFGKYPNCWYTYERFGVTEEKMLESGNIYGIWLCTTQKTFKRYCYKFIDTKINVFTINSKFDVEQLISSIQK